MSKKLSKHFSKDEFECPCCGKCNMDEDFISKLETIRVTLGRAIYINSGFRCRKHNQKIGGSRNSPHLIGKASDLLIANSRERCFIIKYAMDIGITRIGIGRNFLHLDIADESTGHSPWVMWHYY
jgi:uncharacterized protein YcbK (DUF882 family)